MLLGTVHLPPTETLRATQLSRVRQPISHVIARESAVLACTRRRKLEGWAVALHCSVHALADSSA